MTYHFASFPHPYPMIHRRAIHTTAALLCLLLPATAQETGRMLSVVAVGEGQRMLIDDPENVVRPGFNPEAMGYPPRLLAPAGQPRRDGGIDTLRVGFNASGSRLRVPAAAAKLALFEPPPEGAAENVAARRFVTIDLPAGTSDLMLLVFRNPAGAAWRDTPGTLLIDDAPGTVPPGAVRAIHLGSSPAFVRFGNQPPRRLAPGEVAVIPDVIADDQFTYALGWNGSGGDTPDEFREGAMFASAETRMNFIIHNASPAEGADPGEPFGLRMFPQIDDVPAPPAFVLRSGVPDIGGEEGEED